jgi:hypothetical protein
MTAALYSAGMRARGGAQPRAPPPVGYASGLLVGRARRAQAGPSRAGETTVCWRGTGGIGFSLCTAGLQSAAGTRTRRPHPERACKWPARHGPRSAGAGQESRNLRGHTRQGTMTRCGAVAQRSEQRTHNSLAVGSNPTGPTERRAHRIPLASGCGNLDMGCARAGVRRGQPRPLPAESIRWLPARLRRRCGCAALWPARIAPAA